MRQDPVPAPSEPPPPPPADDALADKFREFAMRDAAARRLAPEVVGLTVEQAQTLVGGHAGLSIEFRQVGQEHRLYGVVGGILAEVADGRVVRAE